MRGTVRKISVPRRLVADIMHASIGVPFVSLRRTLNIRQLLEARALAARPTGWAAIFVKAFCLVAKDEPLLRTVYAKWPWPHFYELPRSVGMVAIARVEDGQDCVLPEKIPAADELPLTAINAQIRHAKGAPIEQVPGIGTIRTYRADDPECVIVRLAPDFNGRIELTLEHRKIASGGGIDSDPGAAHVLG